jgi:hypothetical protein
VYGVVRDPDTEIERVAVMPYALHLWKPAPGPISRNPAGEMRGPIQEGTMARADESRRLQTIFSFFLGLMVTAFVGVGVYTFHPPGTEFDRQIEELSRQEQTIRAATPRGELTTEEQDQVQALADQRTEVMEAREAARNAWGRTTSIILIVLATLAMAISLVRAEQLPVISNGLLLGGVFTMVYGVGWIVATDTSVTRFVVMTAALAITLALGYVRFVRGRAAPAAARTGAAAGIPAGDAYPELERRLRDLEERMSQAASALGRGGDE